MTVEEAEAILGPELAAQARMAAPDAPLTQEQIHILTTLLERPAARRSVAA